MAWWVKWFGCLLHKQILRKGWSAALWLYSTSHKDSAASVTAARNCSSIRKEQTLLC